MPTPMLLEELGQQPMADMWLLRAAGFWISLMTGSTFHNAMAQDALQLLQMTENKGWVAGLPKASQTAQSLACALSTPVTAACLSRAPISANLTPAVQQQ